MGASSSKEARADEIHERYSEMKAAAKAKPDLCELIYSKMTYYRWNSVILSQKWFECL